jgi:thiol-disulfide isomerase/thioredoxin
MNLKKTNFVILCLLLLCGSTVAQSIHLHFPAFAGQEYCWMLQQGDGSDTLELGVIPQDGRVILEVPKVYRNTRGMSRWLLKSGGGLDMILAGFDFSVECLSASPNDENIIYTNNPENDFLLENYKVQQKILAQVSALSYPMQLLDSSDDLFIALDKRVAQYKTEFAALQSARAKSLLYAARFGEIVDFTQGIADKLYDNEMERATYLDNWFTHTLEIEDLYTSGHWGQPVFGWVQMNANMLSSDSVFKAKLLDMVNRPYRDQVFRDLVDALIYALVETGKDEDIALLAQNIQAQPHKWEMLSGKAKEHLTTYNNTFGKKAPDLELSSQIETPNGYQHEKSTLKTDSLGTHYTLLLFYQSACGPCEDALIELINNYEQLKEKGVRIIAFSADEDEQLFQTKLSWQPWPDVFCDYKGMKGDNFKNFGILGTPTLIIMDQKGMIKSRVAKARDVLRYFNID